MTARSQLHGIAAIAAALAADQPIEWVVIRGDEAGDREDAVCDPRPITTDPELAQLIALCERQRIAVRHASAREFARLSSAGADECVIAAIAAPARVDLPEAIARGGAIWLVSGTAYPGNAGFVARTAEVSGATAVVIDSPFDRSERRDTARSSLRADRVLPMLFESGLAAIERAQSAGFSVVGIEDVGATAPWEVELTGDVLFVVGGEKEGIPKEQLALCDCVVALPMAGFIPSYNLQAAMAMVCGERLRQLAR